MISCFYSPTFTLYFLNLKKNIEKWPICLSENLKLKCPLRNPADIENAVDYFNSTIQLLFKETTKTLLNRAQSSGLRCWR